MRTPLARVRHLGSAHEGTGHFWRQRLTGAAAVPLVLVAVVVIVMAMGKPHAEVAALIGSPFVAAVFILLFAAIAIHMRIGMQVIIEDYVQGDALKIVLAGLNTLFSIAVAVVAIVAILKLAIGT